MLDHLAGTGHLHGARQARPPEAVARPLLAEVRILRWVLTRVGQSTSPGCVGPHLGWARITELATSSLACTSNSKCAKTSLLFWVRFYQKWRDRQSWRPHAAMGTIRCANKSVLRLLKDTSNDKVLDQPIHPIARQSVFSVKGCLKKKRFPKLPPPIRCRTLSTSTLDNIDFILFQGTRQKPECPQNPLSQKDRLTHVQRLFT